MNAELIRFVDSISRDKNIDKESIFVDIEAAVVSAARKVYPDSLEANVSIDRATGEINASVDGSPVDMLKFGRIAAQTAKQVMIQKIREDERNSIFEEFSTKVGTIITATAIRYEAGGLVVNLGRAEGFLPRSEMIPGQTYQPGERIRGMILDVREMPSLVKIVLSQTHPDYIRKLFEAEVPEVAERIIEIKSLAREAGYRTKIAVTSIDAKVDAVGACVGVKGSRIKNIVDELGGEKIDIVRWNESSQVLISNALKPAEVREIFLCFELDRATVVVNEDQLSLAIGKRGQNVRLASRLSGWDIDILTPDEYNRNVDDMEGALKSIDGVEDILLDKLLAMGIISLADVSAVGVEPLIQELELERELAQTVVDTAAQEAKRIAAERQAAKEAAAAGVADEATEAAAEPTDAVDEAAEPATDAVAGDEPAGDEIAEAVPVEPESAEENSTVEEAEEARADVSVSAETEGTEEESPDPERLDDASRMEGELKS